jgi:hypothetical protein
VLDAEQLAHAGLGSGIGAAQRTRCGAQAHDRERVRLGHQLAEVVPQQRVVVELPGVEVVADQVHQRLDATAERRAAAHRDPLVGQGVARQGPAAVDLADHAVVGHEHVVQEHLVEHLQAGQLTQRPDVEARGGHVDHEVGDAEVLRRAGVGAGEADAPVGLAGHGRPDLLAVEQPAALGAVGRRGQRGQVRAGLGLAEELAPRDGALKGRVYPAFLLFGCAVRGDRRSRPGADLQVGRSNPGAAHLLVDHDLFDRARVTPPRGGPVRDDEPGVGQGDPAVLLGELCDPVDHRRDVGAQLLGLGGQLEGQVPSGAGDRGARQLLAPPSGSAEELAQRHGATQVQVGVVLPGEADAAEHLDHVLGIVDEGVERERTGGGHRHLRRRAPRVVAVEGCRRVPHGGAGRLEARQHVGAAVLDALELADGPAELASFARPVRSGVDAPGGTADRLCCGQHDAHGFDLAVGQAGQGHTGRGIGEQLDRGESRGAVERLLRRGAEALGSEHRPGVVRAGRDDHSGSSAPEHRAVAGEHCGGAIQVRADRVAVGRGGHRPCPGGRQDRAGSDGTAEALEHHNQLGESESSVAVQGEPTQLVELGPERRQRAVGTVGSRTGDLGAAAAGCESGDGGGQELVVVADGQAHGVVPLVLSSVGLRI